APHHHRRGHAEARSRFHRVRLANQETPERRPRAQQRGREAAAFEIAPGVQHVLRTHERTALRGLGDLVPGRLVRGDEAVAVVHDPVAGEERQLVLEPGLLRLQALVDPHRVGRFETRAHHGARRLVLVFEPADLQTQALAYREQVLRRQWHAPIAYLLRRALDVGKIVVAGFLPDTDQ